MQKALCCQSACLPLVVAFSDFIAEIEKNISEYGKNCIKPFFF